MISPSLNHISVDAPAKINWMLRVGLPQPNGYHTIDTVMQRISLADQIDITLIGPTDADSILELTCSDPALPTDRTNLVYRAAEAILAMQTKSYWCCIYLDKQIPYGSGLGGGSSDAAATLRAVNHLLGSPLDNGDLLRLATKLGCDVPFFLHEQRTVRCTGFGEELSGLEATEPTPYLIVIVPDVAISTPLAYTLLDAQRNQQLFSVVFANKKRLDEREMFFAGNEFQTVMETSFAPVQKALGVLRQTHPLHAQMSGSGSACFACYAGVAEQEIALEELKTKIPPTWFMQAVTVVDYSLLDQSTT